ncbi:hypothetical protein F9C11_41000 [Amycolatopsis sp. VS8301801F10]|uniref:hypothetical protein n=1 Tax=unclassified Amycolatopsis TaxID=2618356 RepID=UPI0038FCD9A6
MTGYETDPAQLGQAADGLAELNADAKHRRGALRYSAQPSRAGEVLLARSLERFQAASLRAADLVSTDLARLAERLETAAKQYAAYESDAAAAIEEIADKPPEDNGPSEIRTVLG